jgi:hypothetical protein
VAGGCHAITPIRSQCAPCTPPSGLVVSSLMTCVAWSYVNVTAPPGAVIAMFAPPLTPPAP